MDNPARYLPPIDQLFYLCHEVYEKLDSLQGQVIVIGGQSVNYWLHYYESVYQISEIELAKATSIDVDFSASKEDFLKLTGTWKVDFNIPPIEQATPEIGNSLLCDIETQEIKEVDGKLYVDMAAWVNEKVERANQVDLLRLPTGFKLKDFQCSRLAQHAESLTFPKEFHRDPHEKLLILNPIGAFKSRLLNYTLLKKVKNPAIEVERMKLLLPPIILFLQDKLIENGYRGVRPYIDLWMIIVKSKMGIDFSIKEGIDLVQIIRFVLEHQSHLIPNDFINKEFPYWAEGVERKLVRRIRFWEALEE